MMFQVPRKVPGKGVMRTAPADSEVAGLLRVAWEHGQAIVEAIGGETGGREEAGEVSAGGVTPSPISRKNQIPLLFQTSASPRE